MWHTTLNGIAKPYWLLPVLLAAGLLLFNLGDRAPLDGHEVLVAQTAREMLESGDWIVPTFAGEVRLQKPPLAYWLAASSYWINGRYDPWSARLPVALAGVAGVWLVSLMAGRCFGPQVGTAAGLVHATMAWTIAFDKQAEVDGILTTLVAAAVFLGAFHQLQVVAGLQAPGRWTSIGCAVGFWIFSGLAVLAKGPVALAVIFPTVLAFCLTCKARCSRRTEMPSAKDFVLPWLRWIGPFAFLALALGWPLAVYRQYPAVPQLWQAQSMDRFLVHWGPNTRPWFYYLYQVPLWTLPWTPFWCIELARTIRDARRARLDSGRRLLWIWFLVALAFFSLSAGKREHYILPGLTPLSILAALGVARFCGRLPCAAQQELCPPGLPSRRLVLLKGAFIALIAGLLIHEAIIYPASHQRNGALAMFERRRELIREASTLIQFGSNNRWTIFPIGRQMEFVRSAAEITDRSRDQRDCLVLVPRSRIQELCEALSVHVIDSSGPILSFAEREAREQLLLVAPIPKAMTDAVAHGRQ